MMIQGSASEWQDLIADLVPRIIELVVRVWSELDAPAPDELEDDITRRLYSALSRQPDRDSYPLRITMQHVILASGSDAIRGRQDIAFLPFVANEEIYFCLECKRLSAQENADGRSRAGYSEYVTSGVLRFVTGQYAAAVKHGGMLGYVLNGDVLAAIEGVGASVERHRRVLLLSPDCEGLGDSSLWPDRPEIKETRHCRDEHDREVPFTLHHVFCGKSEGTASRGLESTRTKRAKSAKGAGASKKVTATARAKPKRAGRGQSRPPGPPRGR